VADVEAAIAEMNAGGYQFDYTPEVSGYTDIGWRATIAAGHDTIETNFENPNATIELPVTISGNDGLTAVLLTFSGIDLTGAEVEANFGDLEYNNLNKDLKVIWWNESGEQVNDLMFTITLPYVNGTLPSGTYPITVTASGAEDRFLNDTAVTTSNGSVTITNEFLKGDINRDGELNNADLILIARYLVDLVEFDDEQKEIADFNNDGTISNKDLVLIARAIVAA
jgi:hypothetical protein